MYEILPIGAGVIVGALLGGASGRKLSGPWLGGLTAAALIGMSVSFLSGEWRNGVVYPVWDVLQASCAFALSHALAVRWRRAPRRFEER